MTILERCTPTSAINMQGLLWAAQVIALDRLPPNALRGGSGPWTTDASEV
ncbi:hypothetical protein [Thioclava sp.]